MIWFIFFFNDTATTEIYTLSLHDALPICRSSRREGAGQQRPAGGRQAAGQHHRVAELMPAPCDTRKRPCRRSEEHTSELQSRQYLVCRLLLEKKKMKHLHGNVLCFTIHLL